MSYIIRKTDGTIVATVADGTVDNESTSINLIGKNYKGFGTALNRSLVQLLENFSYSSPPNNMVTGQLWYDTQRGRLNVFDGSNWRPVGSPFVQPTQPTILVQGDLWIDTANQQLRYYDGVNLLLAGPIYTKNQGRAGWIVESALDTGGNGKTIASLYVNNTRLAVLSDKEFTPQLPIPGFDVVRVGLNFSTAVTGNTVYAQVDSAKNLIDQTTGELLDTTFFLRSDQDNLLQGSLDVNSNFGLKVGPNGNIVVSIDITDEANPIGLIENKIANSILKINVEGTNGTQQVIRINPTNKTTTFYPGDLLLPGDQPTVNINANAIIEGSLTVNGDLSYITTTDLQVEDKNIELGVTANASNITAEAGGITLKAGADGDKYIKWFQAVATPFALPNRWTSTEHFALTNNRAFYIGSNMVLSTTNLGDSVINSNLQSVGLLNGLNVNSLSFTSLGRLSVNSEDLEITFTDPVNRMKVGGARISDVGTPLTADDATPKTYVDTEIQKRTVFLTLDITGFINPNVGLLSQLNALCPTDSFVVGSTARIMCYTFINAAQQLNDAIENISPPAQVLNTSGQTVTVLTSISSQTNIPQTNPTINKVVKVYEVQDVNTVKTWVYVRDVIVPPPEI